MDDETPQVSMDDIWSLLRWLVGRVVVALVLSTVTFGVAAVILANRHGHSDLVILFAVFALVTLVSGLVAAGVRDMPGRPAQTPTGRDVP